MTSSRVVMRLVAFAASLVVGQVIGQSGALAASAEQGRVEFLKHGCWQCHGERGQGGVTGPKLAPGPIPFDTLKNFVRTTDRNMPPFREEILSNDALVDIYAYLESIPKTQDPKSIPLLNR